MVQHQVGDDFNAAPVSAIQKILEIAQCAVIRVNSVIIGDIVAIIFEWGWVGGHNPQAVDAQLLEVIELARQALNISVAIGIAVKKGAYVHLIEDRIFVPEILLHCLFSYYPLKPPASLPS